MSYLQAVGRIASGVAGVAVLYNTAKVVVTTAEAVHRAAAWIYTKGCELATGTPEKPEKAKDPTGVWYLIDLAKPGSKNSFKDWTTFGTAMATNIILGTAALYAAHRFCPSLVTNTNSLLHYVVGIQFTPNCIPLTSRLGL
jgi:hypothetical protein